MSKTFYYHGDSPTVHPSLGQIDPGPNEVPDELVPVAEDCVIAWDGLLSHEPHPPDMGHVAVEEEAEEEAEDGGQEPDA